MAPLCLVAAFFVTRQLVSLLPARWRYQSKALRIPLCLSTYLVCCAALLLLVYGMLGLLAGGLGFPGLFWFVVVQGGRVGK